MTTGTPGRNHEHTEVLVAGAGPTGTTLAAILAQGGVDVIVVDVAPGPARESSRATTVHALTLAQLDGLDGAGREIASRSCRVGSSTMWRGESPVAHVRWDKLPGPHPYMADLPQEDTEGILRERLAMAGGRVEWGWSVHDVDIHDGGATVELHGNEGAVRHVTARWVVACDGAHSAVRQAVGIPLRGTTHAERFVLADVALTTDLDAQQSHIFVSTRGVLGVMAMPNGRHRVNGTLVDGEELTDQTLADVMARRLGTAAHRVQLEEVAWVNEYRTHARIADRWRTGPVLLAGDAAHLSSPVSGQGMNLGVQDAVNLGWKLVHVLRRHAPAALVDTYEAERRPAAEHALRLSEANKRRFTARRRVQRALLDTSLRIGHRIPRVHRQLTWGPAGLFQEYRSAAVAPGTGPRSGPRAGEPLARWLPADADWAVLTPATAGPSRLFVPPTMPSTARLSEVAAEHGLDVHVTADIGGSEALLTRPDGFIGWVGDHASLAHHLEVRAHRQVGGDGRADAPAGHSGVPTQS